MADLPKIVGVTAKSEAVRLTDAAPTPAANAIRLINTPRLGGGFLEGNLREGLITGHLWRGQRGDASARFGTVEIVVEAAGVGALPADPASLPHYHPLIKACLGYAAVDTSVVGSENVVYQQADLVTTCTIWLYSYTKLFKLVGCVGNMKLSLRAGQIGTITFTMTGVLREDPTD